MECTVQLVYTCSPSDIINIVDITNITYIQSAQRNNTTSRDWSYNWDIQATAQFTVNDMNSLYLSCHCGRTQCSVNLSYIALPEKYKYKDDL